MYATKPFLLDGQLMRRNQPLPAELPRARVLDYQRIGLAAPAPSDKQAPPHRGKPKPAGGDKQSSASPAARASRRTTANEFGAGAPAMPTTGSLL